MACVGEHDAPREIDAHCQAGNEASVLALKKPAVEFGQDLRGILADFADRVQHANEHGDDHRGAEPFAADVANHDRRIQIQSWRRCKRRRAERRRPPSGGPSSTLSIANLRVILIASCRSPRMTRPGRICALNSVIARRPVNSGFGYRSAAGGSSCERDPCVRRQSRARQFPRSAIHQIGDLEHEPE